MIRETCFVWDWDQRIHGWDNVESPGTRR